MAITGDIAKRILKLWQVSEPSITSPNENYYNDEGYNKDEGYST